MTETSRFAGAVLCGGRSTRMGEDKALIERDGRALAVRVAVALEAAGASPVICVGGDLDALARRGVRGVADDHPGDGPLGGLVTALAATAADLTIVLACDLLQPDAGAIEATRQALLAAPHAGVAVPIIEGRAQWLHAAWRGSTHDELAGAFDRGVRAIHDACARLEVAEVHGLDAAALADADVPADLG